MNCIRFAGILAGYHEGILTAGEKAAAEDHLRKCRSCQSLLEVATGKMDILPEEMKEDLAVSILERTSGGSVCARVESSLWEFANGEQAPDEGQLIALHLGHCAGCSAMAADLALVQRMLPAMAEIDPGESFAREVVSITSGRRSSRPDVRTRLQGWWNRAVQRPRFALEAAYVCTLLLLFAFSPFLPFRKIALQTIPSRAIYPSVRYAASVWTDTGAPISNTARKVALAAVSGNRAVFEAVGLSAERGALASSAALNESLRGIGEWQRKEAARLEALWSHMSARIRREKS